FAERGERASEDGEREDDFEEGEGRASIADFGFRISDPEPPEFTQQSAIRNPQLPKMVHFTPSMLTSPALEMPVRPRSVTRIVWPFSFFRTSEASEVVPSARNRTGADQGPPSAEPYVAATSLESETSPRAKVMPSGKRLSERRRMSDSECSASGLSA